MRVLSAGVETQIADRSEVPLYLKQSSGEHCKMIPGLTVDIALQGKLKQCSPGVARGN